MKLLERIIKDYESSTTAWKGGSRKRSIKINQIELDNMGGSKLLEDIIALEKDNIIEVDWYSRNSVAERIIYSPGIMDIIYERVNKTPKQKRLQEQKECVQKQLVAVRKPWIRSFYQELINKLEMGSEPKELNPENQSLYFNCLSGLDKLEEPVYKRVFSKRYLTYPGINGSKVFEEKLQSKIVSIARNYCADVDDNMEEQEVLAQIYLEEYSQELEIKGNLCIELSQNKIDLSVFTFGIILNHETLQVARIPSGQHIKKIITVENKANFKSLPFEEGTLIIFSHGYFSPMEREFLIKLSIALEMEEVEYYHTGDMDYGGIMIFRYIRNKIFTSLKPLNMDVDTYEIYKDYAEDVKESTIQKLSKLKEPTFTPLINKIIQEKKGIEQESFLLNIFSKKIINSENNN